MKFIATQIVTYQVNDSEFETVREAQIFDENSTFADLKDWIDRKTLAYYRSPAVQIHCLNN